MEVHRDVHGAVHCGWCCVGCGLCAKKVECGVIGTYHIKGGHSVNLDQAMEPAEEDGDG